MAKLLSTADKIMANACALAAELGISEREIARSALTVAIGIAEHKGDPDGYLAMLMSIAAKKGKTDGR